MQTTLTKTPVSSSRQREIVRDYIAHLDVHIQELKEGRAEKTLEIRDFAAMMHLHPVHLSSTVKEVTGRSACDFYEERLLRISKELLLTTNWTIATIATHLTYDPSNFTKFFKQYTGMTPKKFRDQQKP